MLDLHVRVNPADSSITGHNAITYRVLQPATEIQPKQIERAHAEHLTRIFITSPGIHLAKGCSQVFQANRFCNDLVERNGTGGGEVNRLFES